MAEDTRAKIKSAFLAEQVLIDVNEILSIIRDDPEKLDELSASLLEKAFSGLVFDRCYNDLFTRVQTNVVQIFEAREDRKKAKKLVGQTKKIIRNRLNPFDESSPW